MKITGIRLGRISVPLRTPFKTALRTVNSVEDIIVEITTDSGSIGYGEAPPTGAITGDTALAIIGAIQDHIGKTILGRDLEDFEPLLQAVQRSIVGNTSAKAAVDMALWDLYGQRYKIPVCKLLGGGKNQLTRRHGRQPSTGTTSSRITARCSTFLPSPSLPFRGSTQAASGFHCHFLSWIEIGRAHV